jgi:hypothetical protein
MSAHHLPPWLHTTDQHDSAGEGRAGPDYQRISILGRTSIDRTTVDHTIRVFAKVCSTRQLHTYAPATPNPNPNDCVLALGCTELAIIAAAPLPAPTTTLAAVERALSWVGARRWRG